MNNLSQKQLVLDACLVALLVLGTFLVYYGIFENGFLVQWDDNLYVTANPDIKELSFESLKTIFSKYYVENYAPLQMLSYMVDYQLWGLQAFGFLFHNLILHCLNGVLLYMFFRALHSSHLASFLGALLFLFHPVQVESVAWISQRKNLLAMTFLLASLFTYHRYVVTTRLKKTSYGLSSGSFLLSLMAKSVAVILPVVLLAYDAFVRRAGRQWGRCVLEKIPFVLMAATFAWIAIMSQSGTMDELGGIAKEYHGGSGYATFLTMLTVYQKYLANIFWPTGLSASYSVEILRSADSRIIAPVFLLIATVGLPLLFKKEHRAKAFFWVIVFLVGFLPVSQIVPIVTLMHDRYVYFPMLGLCGIVVLLTDRQSFVAPKVAVIFCAFFIFMMSSFTIARVPVWNNMTSLWQDATIKESQSELAWYALAIAYESDGEYLKSIESYNQALRIKPSYPKAMFNLGLAYLMEGDFKKAERILNKFRYEHPDSYLGTLILAHIYYCQNDFIMAGQLYRLAMRMQPGNPDLWNLLSLVELRLGNQQLSSRYWQNALSMGGRAKYFYLNRARLESLKRNPTMSLTFLEKAIQLGFKDAELLHSDRDLRFVRKQQGFRKLVQSLESLHEHPREGS